MKYRVLSFALFLLALLAFGCKGGGSVEGTYTGKSPTGQGAANLTLRADKTFEMTVGDAKTPFGSGTWEAKDKEVKMTATKVMGMDVPSNAQTSETGTLSDDGKTLTVKGIALAKQ